MTVHPSTTDDFLRALLNGNRHICSKIARELLDDKLPVERLYEDVLRTSLYQVGELWETHKISVATEHLASAVVEAVLNDLYFRLVPATRKPFRSVVTCVENEYHQIGSKMVSDLFEMRGWTSHFLGANTPVHELMAFIRLTEPHVIGISLSVLQHLPTLLYMIDVVRKEFPSLPVLIGGQAFVRGGAETIEHSANLYYLPDLAAIHRYIDQYEALA